MDEDGKGVHAVQARRVVCEEDVEVMSNEEMIEDDDWNEDKHVDDEEGQEEYENISVVRRARQQLV